MGDNVSTDEILPAGASVLPLRSNIPAISRFAFSRIDETYHDRALVIREAGGHVVVGGENYGQGSSREHAAIAPRYLGLHAVIAKGFARIHAQNLVNFGVLPITFLDPADYDRVDQGDEIVIPDVAAQIRAGSDVTVENRTKGQTYALHAQALVPPGGPRRGRVADQLPAPPGQPASPTRRSQVARATRSREGDSAPSRSARLLQLEACARRVAPRSSTPYGVSTAGSAIEPPSCSTFANVASAFSTLK